ncbi:MAG: hypothetical protein HOI95_20865 [Chromatiales bacterium]|nr:hypothetical protein [Chromatiales bacterium]
MNIADVEDHQLEGVGDAELYIALLKRVQAANALTQSREAQAQARAASTEATEARRAEVATRTLENDRERLLAETRLALATEKQRATVDVQKAARDAEAKVAGIKAQIAAEHERIAMLLPKFNAEMLVPAEAEKQRLVLDAQADVAQLRGGAQAELDQLGNTVDILQQGGRQALQAYVIENLERFVEPFAETMDLFPVRHASVVTGASGSHAPLSGIYPHPLEQEKARRLQDAFGVLATAAADVDPEALPK